MSEALTYGFTDAELDIAKHTDLLSLLPSLGYTLKRVGSYYTSSEEIPLCSVPSSFPHENRSAEFSWGPRNGDMPISRPVPCLPGVFKYGNPQNRIHLTEKPLQLMRDIVKITEPGGHILDPFAGSGTTVLAAVLEGYSATGIEVTDEYARLARERIERELAQAA